MSATDIAKIVDKIIETRTEVGSDLLNQYEERMVKIEAKMAKTEAKMEKYAEEKIFLHIKKEIIEAARDGNKDVLVSFAMRRVDKIFCVSEQRFYSVLRNKVIERLKVEGFSATADYVSTTTGNQADVKVNW